MYPQYRCKHESLYSFTPVPTFLLTPVLTCTAQVEAYLLSGLVPKAGDVDDGDDLRMPSHTSLTLAYVEMLSQGCTSYLSQQASANPSATVMHTVVLHLQCGWSSGLFHGSAHAQEHSSCFIGLCTAHRQCTGARGAHLLGKHPFVAHAELLAQLVLAFLRA